MPMMSGHIARIESSDDSISGFESVAPDDAEFQKYVNSERVFNLNTGKTVTEGLAVEEYPNETEVVDVDNGAISIGSTERVARKWTRYWLLGDDYVVVKNADGEFAFKLLESALSGEVEEISLDLAQIVRDHPGQWMGGFEDRSDNVRNGIYYGDNVEFDGDLGDAFLDSNKSMIGPDIDYGGDTLRLRIGEGWFQVLRPGSYTREDYLTFFDDYLSQYD